MDTTKSWNTCCLLLLISFQLQKLGVIPFEDKLSGLTLLSYQELWGNNGDIISRQYAGTAAMKVATMYMYYSVWLGFIVEAALRYLLLIQVK